MNDIVSETIYTIIDWFQLLGAIIAFVLLFLQINEYRKKRVSLDITLTKAAFYSHEADSYSPSRTEINITIDLKNTGLEPTTLSGVEFQSDIENLNSVELKNVRYSGNSLIREEFNEVRIDPNDRKNEELFAHIEEFIPQDINEIKGNLIFKTTHKDISKTVTLTRS